VLISSEILDQIHSEHYRDWDNFLDWLSSIFLIIFLWYFTHSFILAICMITMIGLTASVVVGILNNIYQHDFHIHVLLLSLQTIMGVIDAFVIIEAWRRSKRICPPVSSMEWYTNKINRMYYTIDYYWSKSFVTTIS